MNVTPPSRSASSIYIEETAETPGPTRAKVKNLQNQVTELVRTNHALERKHKSTTSTLSASQSELAAARESLASLEQRYAQEKEKWHGVGKKWEAEVQRCRAEGETMRDELNLHSLYLQQKALLALAQEQMQIVDLEEQLLQHETAKLMRDHKLSLFQSREDSLTAELKEKDALLIQAKRIYSKASSKAHSTELGKLASAHAVTQKALIAAQEDLAVSQQTAAEVGALKAKVVSLETTVQGMKAKEKELKEELDGWLRQEGTTDATKKELRKARAELTTRTDELKELQDELDEAKAGAREREKALRAQLRAAGSGGDRVTTLEEEVETLKLDLAKANAKARKAKEALAAVRSAGTEEDEEEIIPPKKKKVVEGAPVKAKKKTEDDARPVQKKKKKPSPEPEPVTDAESEPEPVAPKPKAKVSKTALKDSVDANSKRKSASPDPEPVPTGEKKKKRKIFGAPVPAFQWDSIMASGDGVIPSSLSPVKQTGTGLIPRSGFSSKPAVRRF